MSYNPQVGDKIFIEFGEDSHWHLVPFTGVESAAAISDFAEAVLASITWSTLSGKPLFSTVAVSGSYADLLSPPSLGTASAQDVGYFDGVGSGATAQAFSIQRTNHTGTQGWSTITSTPTTISGYGITDPLVLTSSSYANPVWLTSLAYAKLTGTPTIPSAQVNSDWSAGSGVAQILNKPLLSTVATTGAYSDLTGNPTIPPAITFTTTGSSGASTFNGTTGALNIPVYSFSNQTITLSGDITGSGATAITSTLKNTGTAGTFSGVTTDAQGRVTAGTTWSASNAVSRSISTTNNSANGFQVSSTRWASVSYPVTITTTASIGGPSSGTIILEICATNSATGADWTQVDITTNTQTITLALTLNSVQGMTQSLGADVPPGWYTRIRSLTATGTVTYSTTTTGVEVLK